MSESAAELRVIVTGLVSLAAAEEAILLTDVAGSDGPGTPSAWAALPTVAHTSEFRDEHGPHR